MKPHRTNLKNIDIVSTRNAPAQEILSAAVKQWRKRLGYCSVFASVPALLVSTVDGAHTEEAKQVEPSVAMERHRRRQLTNWNRSNPNLLKRQSEFVLPHQRKNADDLSTPMSAGADDCPGRLIPGGTYTAASPYTDSGDTRGANNSFNSFYYYYYYNFDAFGPDHVYTFTIRSLGSNPQIKLSRTSGDYEPVVYLIIGGSPDACPAGTLNRPWVWWFQYADPSGVATIDYSVLRWLPSNTPIYLVVDSRWNDSRGSGPYTLQLQDMTIGPDCPHPNPLACPEFFVRQQYQDFLGREPDTIGFQNWVNTLTNCPNGGYGEFDNPQCDRVHVSSSFYLSDEFRGRGYWVYRFYEVAFDRRPQFNEFSNDLMQIGGPKTPQQEEDSKAIYTSAFTSRPEFNLHYANLSNAAYVNSLEAKAEVTLPNKQALIDALNQGTTHRGLVLRNIVESQAVHDRFFIRAFVAMQYFGYLKRNPDPDGYINWVNTLEADPSNFRHMIFGFIYSREYMSRFGPP